MQTKRATFSKPSLADYDDLLALHTNELVREYLGGTLTKDEFDQKFKDFLSAELPECYWVVRETGSDKLIGLISISKYHDKEKFEISYELHPDFWGKGYGTEIVQKAVSYALDELKLKELYAETQKKNLKSMKLLEKIGFKFMGEVERFGEDQVIYLIKK
ncbi:GNAT family N-acetyltransferase [Patescibacteria group bacterium]|nr:GNAT family N-acetyltransferase [Patescibacteria group bacterium]MBU1721360.1 GNAT family N-acetyltransferase [Patescibacteria group bacterium]